MKHLLSIVLICILSASVFTGCKKDNGEAPVLPPQESILIDFSNFSSLKKSADTKGTENSNWDFAVKVAGVWKLLITTTLAVPVTSFKLAIDQDPVFLSDKTWQWSYSVTVAGSSYKSRLTGQISGTDVLWKMYLTKEGASEFVWLEGTSKLDGSGGLWTLNNGAQTPEAVMKIEWTKTGTSVGKVKYTYVKNDSFLNSYIEYGLITSTTYDAYYKISYYNGLKTSVVDVEWNTSTKNGRVKCLDYLGTTNWYGWDGNRINI